MSADQPKRPRYDHSLLGSAFAHNAEQAEVQEHTQPSRNIVTPCHGMPLTIYMAFDEVEEIVCSAKECYNSWNPDGTVSHWQERE